MKEKLWEYYPANDYVPEHWSSPYGLSVRTEDNQWEVWLLNTTTKEIKQASDLALGEFLGFYTNERAAKNAVEFKANIKIRLRSKGAVA